jgi:hypothetical protein
MTRTIENRLAKLERTGKRGIQMIRAQGLSEAEVRAKFNRRVEEETASPDEELLPIKWLDSEDYQGGAPDNTG